MKHMNQEMWVPVTPLYKLIHLKKGLFRISGKDDLGGTSNIVVSFDKIMCMFD